MKNLLIILLVCLFVISLSSCKKEQIDNTEKNEMVNPASSNKVDDSTLNGGMEDELVVPNEDTELGINLLEYRPEVGIKKSFFENKELVFTEEIIAENDEYVQVLLQLGGNVTTQIYRWTKNEITLIYEEFNRENPKEDILNSFEPFEKEETIIANNSKGEISWKLLSTEGMENILAGNYESVLIIYNKTDEVVNEETTHTKYYAQNIGLIKEKYEVTGKNGFTAISELGKVE